MVIECPHVFAYCILYNIVLIFTVPAPSSVTVTSDKPNPISPIGSHIILVCTVELSPAVDIPVTVSTVWTGPNGEFFHSDPEAIMENHTVYTSTVTISSFGREQSGNYTCTASVNSSTLFVDDSNSTSNTMDHIHYYYSI